MSETPTPTKATQGQAAPTKRRGLSLPPRGQALARLQDLEAEPGPPDAQNHPAATLAPDVDVSDAVFTASSNAVSTDVINAVPEAEGMPGAARAAVPPDAPPMRGVEAVPVPPATAQRAAREPTTRITVDMPDSLHRRISLLSVEERRTIKDLVIEALHRTYFQTEGEGR